MLELKKSLVGLFTPGLLMLIVATCINGFVLYKAGIDQGSWIAWVDFLAILLAFWGGRVEE